MSRPCECGHAEARHTAFVKCTEFVCDHKGRWWLCPCRGYRERPPYLVALWRWLREVPR